MAVPQNTNGVYVNPNTNKEPSNLCCYTATYPACMNKNIFLTTVVLETEGANKSAGSLANIVDALRGIEKSTNLLSLDADISPSIVPALTTTQKTIIIEGFKNKLA